MVKVFHDRSSRSRAVPRLSLRQRLVASCVLVSFGSTSFAPALAWAKDDGASAQTIGGAETRADAVLRNTEYDFESGTRAVDPGLAKAANEVARSAPEGGEGDAKASEPAAVERGISGDLSAGNKASADVLEGVRDVAAAPPRQTLALPTGADKTGVSSQAITTPKGSGTIQGMGESFSAQLSTGIASFSVPFALPAARGGAQPSLGLSYSSSSGSGLAGIGWSVGVPFIARQTDRGTPRYDDRAAWHPEQDRFVFNGGQELVPVCLVQSDRQCGHHNTGKDMPPWAVGWQFFMPRVVAPFLRFFWSPDHQTWRVQDGSGVMMELGLPLDGTAHANGIERNPERPNEIYRWHLVRQLDLHGVADAAQAGIANEKPVNVVHYRYKQDGGTAYLEHVFDTSPASDPSTVDLSKFAHHTRLVYELRTDLAASYRSGWRIESRLRLKRVDVASKTFVGGPNEPRRALRRYHLEYEFGQHQSLLTSVQVEGRCAGTESEAPAEGGDQLLPEQTGCERLPAMRFAYSHVAASEAGPKDSKGLRFEPFDRRVLSVTNSPAKSIDDALTDLYDVNADALPDVLVTEPGAWGTGHGVFFNGAAAMAARFGTATNLSLPPGTSANTLTLRNINVSPLDADGDGRVDLVHSPDVLNPLDYFLHSPQRVGDRWEWTKRAVSRDGRADFGRDMTGLEVADVNGDGLVDLVKSSGSALQTWFSLGRYPGGEARFGTGEFTTKDTAKLTRQAQLACVPTESGQLIMLDNPEVRFAEMNGDGLPDLVRVTNASVMYWPGRGNGYWGTGSRDECLLKPGETKFSQGKRIMMEQPNRLRAISANLIRLDDVNGDGLDDLIEIQSQGIAIWLNVDGNGWSEQSVISGSDVPFNVLDGARLRLADINGSGTRDLFWGDGRKYQYIDLQGGQRPWLLTSVDNGLGKTTDIEYTTSTAEMLAADKLAACDPKNPPIDTAGANVDPWSVSWCTRMPMVAHVVKRVIERDNLDKIPGAARAAGVYETEYQYRDPVYDGRQREFRGFRQARIKKVGDANSPTDYSESQFLLGECEDADDTDNIDPCAERWRDNPREALKGLPVITHRYNEQDVYLSTVGSIYEHIRLHHGLDGRDVWQAHLSNEDLVRYDTAKFGHRPRTLGGYSFVRTLREPFVVNDQKTDRKLPLKDASAAIVRKHYHVSYFGARQSDITWGCQYGDCGPEKYSIWKRTYTDETGASTQGGLPGPWWLIRTRLTLVQAWENAERLNETRLQYNSVGDLIKTTSVLRGTLPLDRSAKDEQAQNQVAEGLPVGQSQDGEIITIHERDQFGNLTFETQESTGRCRSVTYEEAYGLFPVAETVYTGEVASQSINGKSVRCGDRTLTTGAAFDFGLAQATTVIDFNGHATFVSYDGFGRFKDLRRPPPNGWGDAINNPAAIPASVAVTYTLGSPYSVIRTKAQDGASHLDEQYLESISYVDGLGRTLASLSEAEQAGTWIVAGVADFDKKGAVARKYLPRYWSESNVPPLGLPSDVPFGRERYDAFGRVMSLYDIDGTETLRKQYHTFTVDSFDAADLQPGQHEGTYATERTDIEGRVVQTTERIRNKGKLEERHVQIDYLANNLPRSITRRLGTDTSTEVKRWMRYDSLGRMVLNVEPNTTLNFQADPSTSDLSSFRAWRYAYNDAGELVGTSDARGCGANYFYDASGRLKSEDYWPCEPQHPDYSRPNESAQSGVEVLYVYDSLPQAQAGVTTPPANASAAGDPNYQATNAAGRLIGVQDRGSSAWTMYDARGRATLGAVRVARPGAPANGFENRYAPRWYYQQFAFDAADREIHATTGSRLNELAGTAITAITGKYNRSLVSTEYTPRGTVKSVGGSYKALVQSIDRSADGLVNSIVYGDLANTTTDFSYDERRRLSSVQTYRGPPIQWSNPATNYLPTPTFESITPSTFQLVLQDEEFKYDVVGNPIEIRDWRNPLDWPAGAAPVHRSFKYDDLYRVTSVEYEYPAGDDTWVSPFEAEVGASPGLPDPRRAEPSPHVRFDKRIQSQSFEYDWLGNTARTDDDAHGFYDRSLGAIVNDTSAGKPYQLKSASNEGIGGERSGAVQTKYDAAGYLIRLDLKRNGPCLPTIADCSQRFAYEWDEIGRLTRAQRWDVSATALTTPDAALPTTTPDADLRYVYDGTDQRVIKTAVDAGGNQSHTVYIFGSLELRRAEFAADAGGPGITDYKLTAQTEVPYLFAHGVRLARVVFEDLNDGEPRIGSSRQHVLFELGDHLGSASVVLDKATGELVERSTFQAYGAAESDYRPERWKGFREDYRFTGKEEDIEVGLQYFGKRYYAPALNRWVSADPLAVHVPGTADLNLYAYVSGQALQATDPLGLCTSNQPCPGQGVQGAGGNDDAGPNQPKPPPSNGWLDFDPTSRAQARAAGTAMGGSAAAIPIGGELLLNAAMEDLRNKLASDVYDAWLQGVVAGAEAAAIAALATMETSAGGGLALAPATGGTSVAVGGGVAAGAGVVAANAQVVVVMAINEFGRGRVDVSSSGVVEGSGVQRGRQAPEKPILQKPSTEPARSISPNQMNKQIKLKQAPSGVTRVDVGKIKGEQTHVHFNDGSALNIDGTWKHMPRKGKPSLTTEQRTWLENAGWTLPE